MYEKHQQTLCKIRKFAGKVPNQVRKNISLITFYYKKAFSTGFYLHCIIFYASNQDKSRFERHYVFSTKTIFCLTNCTC